MSRGRVPPGRGGMSRAEYVALAMAQPADWLRACIADPSPYMRPRYVLLLRVALRRKVQS